MMSSVLILCHECYWNRVPDVRDGLTVHRRPKQCKAAMTQQNSSENLQE